MGDTMNQTGKNDDLIKVLERMHRWRMAFFALVILLAGIVIGASSMTIFGRRQMMGKPHSPEIAVERMMRELIEHMDLTAQQRQAIRPMLLEHMEKLHQIRMDVRPQIQQQLANLNEDVSALLDEKQEQQWQREFQRLQNQFHRGPRQRRWRHRGGLPPRFEGDRDGPRPRFEDDRDMMPEHGPDDYPEGTPR
jgi:hypothetical protein